MEIYSKRPFLSFTHMLKNREKNVAQPQDSDNSGKSPSAHEYDNGRNRRIDKSPIAQEYDNSRNRRIDKSPIAQEYDNSRNRRIDKSPIAQEYDNSRNRRIDKSPSAEDYDKSNTVRVVHRGGSVEVFHQALSARVLMETYPDYVVTRSDVFQRPKDAVLNADAVLMPGNTFYLLSRKGIHKLLCKERMNQKKNNNSSSNTELSSSKDLPASKKPRIVASAMTYVTQFISSAKELYGIHRDHGQDHKFRERIGGLLEVPELHKVEDSGCENGEEQSEKNVWQFVPPLDDFEFYRNFSWRPTLPVIQELSP